MNPQGPQGQAPLLPIANIIKPDQVATLPFLSREQKAQYTEGTRNLWRKVQDYPSDHPERMNAYRRLSDISNRLKREMLRWRNDKNGAQMPPDHSQQLHRDLSTVMTSQANPRQIPQGPGLELSDRIKAEVRTLPLALPAALKGRSVEEQKNWVDTQKRQYAQQLQKYESAMKQKQDFTEQINNRRRQGHFTPDEQQAIQARAAMIQNLVTDAQTACMTFKKRHEQAREQQIEENQRQQQLQQLQHQQQQQQMPQIPQQAPPITQTPTKTPLPPQTTQTPQTQDNSTVEPSNQGALVPEVPGATVNQQEQPSISTPEPAQQSASVTQNSQAQLSSLTSTITHPHSGKPARLNSLQDSPSSAQSGAPNSQGPHPLTHQDALDKASRSYNQTAQPSHAHPPPPLVQSQREQPTPATTLTNKGMRPINVAPPTQVQLAPARPTLSGGPGAVGPMGQPAIQKHPGFVLEGDGERVLSKKKLEELVRQVTGGSGAGSEGVEILDPDVEEVSFLVLNLTDSTPVPRALFLIKTVQTLLDVADEFVDNVITAACRLAKLRQSSLLELRDIQLILERNYNIRVPGYASDELRTVKKIQPTQAWTQKMSAVQAAKVTGGKPDV